MRSIVQHITPRALTHLFARPHGNRVYSSYSEALLACGSSYDNDEIARVVAMKTEIFRDQLQATPPDIDLGAMRTLVGLACTDSAIRQLRVLDFGGACGYHYFIARMALSGVRTLDWRVVETPAMVRASTALASSELSFYTSIDQAVKSWHMPPDLVLASGVLQCVPEPLATCRQLVDIDAGTLFITRTGLSRGDRTSAIVHRSTLSSNGPGPLPAGLRDTPIEYPTTFVPVRLLEEVISSRYRVIARITEDVGAYRAGSDGIDMFGFLARRR